MFISNIVGKGQLKDYVLKIVLFVYLVNRCFKTKQSSKFYLR